MFNRRQEQEAPGAGRAAEPESAVERLEREAPREPGPRVRRSVIQADLVIKGAILANGELELHGLVDGDVIARSVVIGATAKIRGDLIGERVSISGDVRGKVRAQDVHLGAEARYFGDIRRGALTIDNGAVFEGQVASLDAADEAEIADRLQAAIPQPIMIDGAPARRGRAA